MSPYPIRQLGMEPMAMKQFYSIKEAAEYLQVDYKVVYRLVREGKIPSTRVGWQYRMTQEDLNAYLNVQRVKQTMKPESDASAIAARDLEIQSPFQASINGAARGSATAIRRVHARQMEQNLVNRFQERIQNVAVIQHPINQKELFIDDWESLREVTEDREALMRALNTAFLDRQTLATTPRNTRVRYRIPGDPALILEIRFVGRLERYCKTGTDDAPVTIEELMVILEELTEEQKTQRSAHVVGLASPTGWTEDAVDYIRNTGRGTSFRNEYVRPFLIDLRTDAVYYDELNEGTARFAGLFRLPTEVEDQAVLVERIRSDLAGRSGIILGDFAQEIGVSLELIQEAARTLASEANFRLIEDQSVGWMLVRV